MMWWIFITKNKILKELKKIASAFKSRDKKIKEVEGKIVSKKEIELMIREATIKIKEGSHELREVVRTTTRSKERKKADKILDKAELLHELRRMRARGLSTTDIYDIIVKQKKMCKGTCFYKYLKKLREPISRTTRSNIAN